jgi:hypothetical protein
MLAAGPAIGSDATMDSPFPAAFELRSLDPRAGGDGSAGFILRGIDANDYSGYSVSGAGDVNGDGRDDLIIGATGGDPNDHQDGGESYVVFGRTGDFPAAFELRSLHPGAGGDGSAGFILKGIDQGDRTGSAVSGAGDINGDGLDDLLIVARRGEPNGQLEAGETYVVFGRAQGFPAAFELRRLDPAAGGDGSAGFILKGIDADDYSGSSVSEAGDVNGDGIDDLIIGARGGDTNGPDAGESYVVFGRTTSFPAAFELSSLDPAEGGDGSEGFILNGIDIGDQSGSSVSGTGDVNGDGVDDLLIGAPGAGANANHSGESYVVFGRATGFPAVFELSDLAAGDGSAGFILEGIDQRDSSGRSVSGAGDVNGDGAADLLIGAMTADPLGGFVDAGESYVVFGRAEGFPAVFELGSLDPAAGGDGSAGFILQGINVRDFSGVSVSGAGDVNGDGFDDLLIGAYWADPSGRQEAGESYVVFGRATDFPAAFKLSSLHPGAGGDGSAGVMFKGIDAGDSSGRSVSGAGDMNGDGLDDLFIGARLADVNGQSGAGESYVVFGRPPATH